MTLDKTIQEKKEMSISKWISDKICSYCNVDKKNYQKMKYGSDIIYINISKTAFLIILSVILGIVKETLLLLSVFTCVRLSGFGYHSNNTIKCTVVGIIGFISSVYMAIMLKPINIIAGMVVYLICLIIFLRYAPIETMKRPIGNSRKKFFKKITVITATCLFIVAFYMSVLREMVNLVKHSPKSDTLVLLTTMVLTVVFDLVVAIEVGIVMAALLFLKRMADVTEVRSWKYIGENIDENNDPESINLKKVPDKTLVYEIIGPMFFAAADKFMDIHMESDVKVVIIRMRGVPAMDISALRSLKNIHNVCKKRGITMVLSHVQEQPKSMMEKAGFAAEVGEDNFCANIDAALAYAQEIVG